MKGIFSVVTVVQWTGREARALRDALRMSVRDFAAHANLSTSAISEMEAKGEQSQLRPSTKKILDEVLATAPQEARQRFRALLGRTALQPTKTATAGRLVPQRGDDDPRPAPAASIDREVSASVNGGRDVLDGEADESLRVAVRAWSWVAPDAAVEQVWQLVRTLARDYAITPPVESLSRARRVRDLGLELLESTRRPRQAEQLYLGVGHACAVMGIATFDLRAFSGAVQQATAASLFAEMVGHSGLFSWARGHEAQTAFWCGRPAEAVRLAAQAVAIAPAGTAQARMLCIMARAYSYLGDGEQTRQTLADARRVRDSPGGAGADELHDEIGGPFGWGPARQAACASNALLRIGDADAAADQARLAIALHDTDGTGTLVDARASADLAAAELARDDLDAAQDALERVWHVPPPLRRYGLLARLEDIATALTRPHYHRSTIAGEVREQITAFTDSAPRALPAGVG